MKITKLDSDKGFYCAHYNIGIVFDDVEYSRVTDNVDLYSEGRYKVSIFDASATLFRAAFKRCKEGTQ